MKKVANFEGYFPLTIVLLTRMVCVSFGKNSMHFSNASLNEECKEKMLLSRGAGKFQLSFLEYKSKRLWLVFFCLKRLIDINKIARPYILPTTIKIEKCNFALLGLFCACLKKYRCKFFFTPY